MFLGTFLENFRPPRVHWAQISAEKLPRSMLKTCLNTFGNVFRHFENWKFFQFFEVFPSVDPTGCTGHFFPRKLPENKSKTCVETFKIVFGHFWEFNFFSDFFFQVLQISISRLHWARKIRKNYLKQVWTFLITFFGILNFWSHFDSCGFFWVSRVHWADLFSVEIIKQNMPKQCFWERFWRNLKVSQFFHFFVFFASFDHPGCTGQNFLPKKYLEACWKHVWLLLGTFFQAFWTIESFSSFLNFFQVSTLQGKLVIFLTKKTTTEHVENLFEHFWERFW